ncbi:MAG: hypothetical protein FJ088_12780, partial [Deltaproteobacteria bacterium]|nr:hypothetical protein [Deltaproteobacteria bacterium]
MRKITGKKREHGLSRVLRKFSGKNVFVAILGSPDPDGIASAWALSIIARKYKVRADLICFESITRLENSDFVRRLNIPLRQVNSS